MKIYIAGAGAMGSRFGYQLTTAGVKVTLLDTWNEHIEAVKTRGLKATGHVNNTIQLPIMRPEEAQEPADYIILFVKSMQLEEMMEALKPIITADTQVLCLLNGLGHQETLERFLTPEQIIMGVTIWGSTLQGPGHVHLVGSGNITLQSLADGGKERTADLIDKLNQAELNAQYSEDVLPQIWRKATLNGTTNAICTLLDVTIGEFFDTTPARRITAQIVHEFVSAAQTQDVELDEQETFDYVLDGITNVRGHYPSMHQDLLQNNRLTEIDYINGAIARIGKQKGLETPYCTLITDLIHAKEETLGLS